MQQKIYQVDAFTDKVFSGNPAAVCPLESWLDDDLMQKIAQENNLAETAFYVKQRNHYEIRWFTPTIEVDLCGHATLAAAFVLFNWENHTENIIYFYSPRSGELTVSKKDDLLTLNFPVDEFEQVELTVEIAESFNIHPSKVFKGKTDFLLVYKNEDEIKVIKPNLDNVSKLNCRGVIVTAKGNSVDFVSRFFAPQSGVNEDPVTGSAHTTLTSYWAKELGKTKMRAMQLSQRQGFLTCKLINQRVEISGHCKLYLIGELSLV